MRQRRAPAHGARPSMREDGPVSWRRERRHRGRGWPVGLVLIQFLLAFAFAQSLHKPVTWPQAAFLVAGPLALALLFRRPAYAAATVLAIDAAYLLLGFPFLAVLPSTAVSVVGPIGRARREAYQRWQEEERLRREAEAQRKLAEERQRAADERVRIARELHDILAHSLSLINVRASVALEVPEEVRPALLAIKQASRDGLAEVRSVLAGLYPAGTAAPRTPAPDLSRLDDLVSQAKSAGLDVAVEIVGVKRALPAAVELAAYRIVQEALTNVMRHSEARAATVVVQYARAGLLVGIGDEGPAQRKPDGHVGGRGIVGVQERASSLGGYAAATPDGRGGFLVMALLPSTPKPDGAAS
jgi:signal transduction histidine kinase